MLLKKKIISTYIVVELLLSTFLVFYVNFNSINVYDLIRNKFPKRRYETLYCVFSTICFLKLLWICGSFNWRLSFEFRKGKY